MEKNVKEKEELFIEMETSKIENEKQKTRVNYFIV